MWTSDVHNVMPEKVLTGECMSITDYDIRRDIASSPILVEAEVTDTHGIK